MRKKQNLSDDAALLATAERYRTYFVEPLGYGTVRDFCDSFDHLHALATANGDLKDLQRPWMLKAILSRVEARGGRLLEIGAGEPFVADLLRRLGYEVWIVDPYDGSGNGPTEFGRFRREYRDLRFIRERFSAGTHELKPASFDCIYSISVLEHIPSAGLEGVMAGVRRFLKPDGISIHAVDHVHRGKGADLGHRADQGFDGDVAGLVDGIDVGRPGAGDGAAGGEDVDPDQSRTIHEDYPAPPSPVRAGRRPAVRLAAM